MSSQLVFLCLIVFVLYSREFVATAIGQGMLLNTTMKTNAEVVTTLSVIQNISSLKG